MKILNNSQIVDVLIKNNDLDNDSQLARHYNVSRQQIWQFRKSKRVGLAQLIMSELLNVNYP